jgi:hypothetical protein
VAALERDDEAIAALQCREHARGVVSRDDRVTQPAAHPIENGRAGQEPDLLVREVRQQLGSQVVRDEPVIAAERRDFLRPCAPRLQRQRSEIQACRPALGPFHELADGSVLEIDARVA